LETSNPILHTVPEQLARQRPDCIALRHGSRGLSYAELHTAARQFANYLAQQNVSRGSTVAICMERSFDWIVAAFGVLLTGAAYVPLDTTWPDARLRFALRDSGAKAIVAQPEVLARMEDELREGDIHGIDLGRDERAIATAPEYPLEPVDPDGLAYIIYTSGSSGTPKGVEITHRNLSHLVKWHVSTFGITGKDRASHLAGLGFDAAVWEMWGTLSAGATLCLADDEVRSSPELIQQWILREGITVSFVPTVHAASLMGMVWPSQTTLRILLTGGEALLHSPPKKLPFVVVNNYGPTECTVVATSTILPPGSPERPPIGRAISGAYVYLLDEDGKQVPDGTVAELYIGGAGVGRGYRNLPDATGKAFLPDVLSRLPGARMYRTGDKALRRGDGQIEFRGRVDRQVKIRGFRIELDEIGAVLAGQPQVGFATAVVKQSSRQEDQIVAYVLAKEDAAPPTVKELQDWVLGSLPEYMVPAVFVKLNALPLSPNGKIDLALLPEPSDENALERKERTAPRSRTEAELLALAQELLEQPGLTIDDNFFLAGGHSLLSMQLVLKLRKGFGVELALSELFGAPTVELLTRVVDQKQAEQRIAAIWADVLGHPATDMKASFFAMGGTELLLESLQQRIEADLGRDITLEELTTHDTISQQATLIQERQFVAEVSLPLGVLPLRSDPTRTPIFWVHYLSANLARAMPDDQPFIHLGLVTEDIRALGEQPTLHRIAACFVTKILATQRHGPYLVGGSCLGGILAYEIASQLRFSGREVSLLVMIDTPSPSYFKTPNLLTPRLRHPQYLLKRVRRIGPRSSYSRISARLKTEVQRILGKEPNRTEVEAVQHMIETAARSYRPTSYDGKVALILAADHPPHIDFLSEWTTLIPHKLYSQYLAAHHSELMTAEGVQSVANAIASRIASTASEATHTAEPIYTKVHTPGQSNARSSAPQFN
jgi:amino acid adenylation domain-containing protein